MKLILLLTFLLCLIPCPAQENKSLSLKDKTSEILYPVESKPNLWGFINVEGKIIVEPQYTKVGYFSEGLAPVCFYDKRGCAYINNKGEIVLPFKFRGARPFYDGVANIDEGFNVGLIDKTGKVIVKPRFFSIGEFHEGLAAASPEYKAKWGYINKRGVFVIKPQFDDARDFSKSLAAVQKGEKRGFVDKTGRFVVNPNFYLNRTQDEVRIDEFNEGLKRFEGENGKMGYKDESGKIVITPQWDEVREFKDGVAVWLEYPKINISFCVGFDIPGRYSARDACGRWGYLDKTGREIWRSENNFRDPSN